MSARPPEALTKATAGPENMMSRKKKLPKKICLPQGDIPFYGDYADVYRVKWAEAVERIEGLGIPVEYIEYTMFQEAASILYDGPLVAERWLDLGGFVSSHPGKVFPVTEQILPLRRQGGIYGRQAV